MAKKRIKNIFLHGGLEKEEFKQIFPLVWKRNGRILKVTSLLSAAMGFLFLLYATFTRSGTWLPYFILMAGSVVIFILSYVTANSKSRIVGMLLCYIQMLLICAYAGILSTQISNYAIPATSIVVFIAIMPLTIDDRLIRMYFFVILESVSYLVVSHLFKSPAAFSLDLMNVVTFSVIGMTLYGVISTRNIREIHQGERIDKIQKSIITSMATVVEERDESTGGHILRTEDYVSELLEKLKKFEKYSKLGEEYAANVMLAAPMHDIGKIKIPDSILNKPGRLTRDEFEVMKKHSDYGAEIISKTMRNVENEDYFEVACNIAKYHHERYDGTGYPDGLKGDEIPLEARIMALADVYDALVSERVYKKALSKEEAVKIIEEGKGTQFDPELAELFLECIKKSKEDGQK